MHAEFDSYELKAGARNLFARILKQYPGCNESVTMAGEAHTGCLAWEQKPPVEEIKISNF